MKRIIVLCTVLIAIVLIAPPAFAKMVDLESQKNACDGIRNMYNITNNYRNKMAVEYKNVHDDMVAHPERYDSDDITNFEALDPTIVILKDKSQELMADIDTYYPDIIK